MASAWCSHAPQRRNVDRFVNEFVNEIVHQFCLFLSAIYNTNVKRNNDRQMRPRRCSRAANKAHRALDFELILQSTTRHNAVLKACLRAVPCTLCSMAPASLHCTTPTTERNRCCVVKLSTATSVCLHMVNHTTLSNPPPQRLLATQAAWTLRLSTINSTKLMLNSLAPMPWQKRAVVPVIGDTATSMVPKFAQLCAAMWQWCLKQLVDLVVRYIYCCKSPQLCPSSHPAQDACQCERIRHNVRAGSAHLGGRHGRGSH